MLALVTGATGFLGSSLVERLIVHGQDRIRCLVRPGSNVAKLDAIGARYPQAHIEYVTGSLEYRESARACTAGVDIVYHLAAGMRGSYADVVLNTVVASRNLLDAIVADNVARVVTISSFAIYGVGDLPRGAVVNEGTPLEPHAERRDPYTFGKLRQEQLFHEYQRRAGFQLVVMRPGVIYGPGGGAMSTRVGIQLPGLFLNCGGSNPLPLSYVDNCADAIAVAGTASHASADEVYNVHDDGLPTCGEYLRRYRREVERIRAVRVPYAIVILMSRFFEWYSAHSNGQLPAFMTPYKSACFWKGNRFDNSKLKSLGWSPAVPVNEGLARTFEYLRSLKRA